MKRQRQWLMLLLIVTLKLVAARRKEALERVVEWRLLEFGFPTAYDRQQALMQENLEPANAVPIDVIPLYARSGSLRILTTIPRFSTGIPYTLATVTSQSGPNGPILNPYPSYDMHNNADNCDAITSAFRVATTQCQQLWVIDSGVVNGEQICPPQLLLFDLNTDQLIHRHRFNSSVYTPGASLLITPVVVVNDPPPYGECRDAMVYVADVNFHGLVVYNYGRNMAWRIENRFMYPDPNHGTITISGKTFTLMDGMFGMAATKENLYFHPLASISEYMVPLEILNNNTIWEDNPEAMPEEFQLLGQRRSQCAATALDSYGNLYCVTTNPIKLVTWNVHTPYNKKNLRELHSDRTLLEFVSGMKVVRNPQGKEELWMLSNRFQRIATGSLNPREINFRILRRSLSDVMNANPNPIPGVGWHTGLIFN